MGKTVEQMRKEIYDYYERVLMGKFPALPDFSEEEFPRFKTNEGKVYWTGEIRGIHRMEGFSYFYGDLLEESRRNANGRDFRILVASDKNGIRTFEEYSEIIKRPFFPFQAGVIILDKYRQDPETEKGLRKYLDICSRLINLK